VDGLIKLFNRFRAEFLLFSVPPPAEKEKEITIAWWGQGEIKLTVTPCDQT